MAGHSPSGFSDRVQNAWFHQLWQVIQVLKLQSSPRPSRYHHHVWLSVWCSFYEMLCWFYIRCNRTHTFQKVQQWGLQIFRCCSGFFYDLLDESTLCSWSNFGRPATPGKVHHCYKFSPFVDNGSDRGSLESQSLRNGFITLSRLTRQLFFSHLFLNFFKSRHDVLLFKSSQVKLSFIVIPLHVVTYSGTKCRASQDHGAT